MSNNHQEVYIQEAIELLDELEATLMELEDNSEDIDIINKVFRAMHTIKGSGAMFGFENIAVFTHDVENIYDMVRNEELSVNKFLIDITLKACDQIRLMLDDNNYGMNIPEVSDLVTKFQKFANISNEDLVEIPSTVSENIKNSTSDENKNYKTLVVYRIKFKPNENVFMMGFDPMPLFNELRELGDVNIIPLISDVPLLSEFNPESFYLSWEILLTSSKTKNDIMDIFIFVEDDCEISIDIIDECDLESDDEYKRVGDILIEKGEVSKDAINKVLEDKKLLGELLVEEGLVKTEHVEAALKEQKFVKEAKEKKKVAVAAASVRVPSEKLDKLIDLVGELVTVQARLNQTATQKQDQDLQKIAEEVERLTWELRDNTMSIRMLPIGSTFSKFRRLVRDLSRDLNKDIVLTTEGAETELDKTVIEKLNDPMVHLIRNSLDHGIETPEERIKAGKSPTGTILLSAKHSGASVVIQIKDDGKGINSEVIRQKGIEKGLITADMPLSEKEIFDLILAPGFSTAEVITNVSGRGVGMDVVKKNIELLRGRIDISSRLGEGTTISLKLPLTLAIIDGLLVQVSDEYYIIPLSVVEECIELSATDASQTHGRDIINVRDEIVPYIRLREYFNFGEDKPEIEQIVVCEVDDKSVGFVVDNVIGDHQTVIKSLGKAFENLEGISGATILGDGTVALILDIPKLVSLVANSV